MAGCQEKPTPRKLPVEGTNAEQFQIYIENWRGCLASLPFGVTDYGAKKKLLQHAVDNERSCAEHLRTVSTLTVQANAEGENLTAARRTALLVSLHQALFNARK